MDIKFMVLVIISMLSHKLVTIHGVSGENDQKIRKLLSSNQNTFLIPDYCWPGSKDKGNCAYLTKNKDQCHQLMRKQLSGVRSSNDNGYVANDCLVLKTVRNWWPFFRNSNQRAKQLLDTNGMNLMLKPRDYSGVDSEFCPSSLYDEVIADALTIIRGVLGGMVMSSSEPPKVINLHAFLQSAANANRRDIHPSVEVAWDKFGSLAKNVDLCEAALHEPVGKVRS